MACDHEPTCSHPCVECMEDERDRYREGLEQVVLNLDGENRDGNIFPLAALRASRDALSRTGRTMEDS